MQAPEVILGGFWIYLSRSEEFSDFDAVSIHAEALKRYACAVGRDSDTIFHDFWECARSLKRYACAVGRVSKQFFTIFGNMPKSLKRYTCGVGRAKRTKK